MTSYIIDSNNSSTSTLTAGSVFTGSSSPAADTDELIVIVHSDADSTSEGLEIQFSQDETNWDGSVKYTYYKGKEYTERILIQGSYYRIVYTNGSANQSEFRLQVLKHNSNDFFYAASVGDYSNRFSLQKFGHIDGPSASVWSDINTWGNYTYDSANTTLQVSSNSAGEVNIDIIIQGVNSSGVLITETITTDGSDGRTPVVGVVPFYRVFRAYVDTNVVSGSSDFYVAKGGTTPTAGVPDVADRRAEMLSIHLQTSMALYSVPTGYRMVVSDVQLSAQKSTTVHVQFIAQIRPMDQSKPWRTIYHTSLTNFNSSFIAKSPWVVPGGYDIRMRCYPDGTGTFVSAGWNAILEKI